VEVNNDAVRVSLNFATLNGQTTSQGNDNVCAVRCCPWSVILSIRPFRIVLASVCKHDVIANPEVRQDVAAPPEEIESRPKIL